MQCELNRRDLGIIVQLVNAAPTGIDGLELDLSTQGGIYILLS